MFEQLDCFNNISSAKVKNKRMTIRQAIINIWNRLPIEFYMYINPYDEPSFIAMVRIEAQRPFTSDGYISRTLRKINEDYFHSIYECKDSRKAIYRKLSTMPEE